MSARVLYAISAIALMAGCAKSTEEAAQVLSPEFAASRGYDAYNAGNITKAEAYFEIALEADPDNPYARLGLDEVRATLDDRTRARQVVAASRATIADTPDRVASIAPERVEPRSIAVPVEMPGAEVVAEEAVVAEAVAVEALVYEDVDLSVPAYTGVIEVETAPVPMVAISPVPLVGAGSEDAYQVVGSYEAYMATLDTAAAPEYVASASPAAMIDTGVTLASVQVEGVDTVEQASLAPVLTDPVLTVETVAIPDPVALDYTNVATAYPVQNMLEYGQSLNFVENAADVAVQGGGQGVTIAASGPAGGMAIYGPVLDLDTQPAMAGAQAIQPESWILPSISTNGSVVLK